MGERLDLPAPAITEAVVDDLPQKGVRQEATSLLHELFKACNQYRYTPEHAAREMNSLIPEVKIALKDLQAMPDAPAKARLPAGVGIVLLLWRRPCFAPQAPSDLFIQANRLYEEGKFAQSAAGYEKIIQAGSVSSALYFNLGNAWLKAGQFGKAILSYRQAEAIAPRPRTSGPICKSPAPNPPPALPRCPALAGRAG